MTALAEVGLDSPAEVMRRLMDIEDDLAVRQNGYERAAGNWFRAKREQGKNWSTALLQAQQPSVTAAKAEADLAAYTTDGAEFEAEFEATKAVLKVLETRAMVCMAILKAQGRA